MKSTKTNKKTTKEKKKGQETAKLARRFRLSAQSLGHIMSTEWSSADKLLGQPCWWPYRTQGELFYGPPLKVISLVNLETALTYSDVGSNVISADTNADFTVLAVSKKEGIVQFYSIADLQNIFLFK